MRLGPYNLNLDDTIVMFVGRLTLEGDVIWCVPSALLCTTNLHEANPCRMEALENANNQNGARCSLVETPAGLFVSWSMFGPSSTVSSPISQFSGPVAIGGSSSAILSQFDRNTGEILANRAVGAQQGLINDRSVTDYLARTLA